jgi:hypothetical protein
MVTAAALAATFNVQLFLLVKTPSIPEATCSKFSNILTISRRKFDVLEHISSSVLARSLGLLSKVAPRFFSKVRV